MDKDVNTDKIDFGRAAMLLDVVHKCASVGPQLSNLGGAALVELTKLNGAIKVVAQQAEADRQKAEALDRATKAQADRDLAEKEAQQQGAIVAPRAYPSTRTETLADQNAGRP